MYEYINPHLPVTFNNYFKLITDLHPYNTRQTKSQQFALPTRVQPEVLKCQSAVRSKSGHKFL